MGPTGVDGAGVGEPGAMDMPGVALGAAVAAGVDGSGWGFEVAKFQPGAAAGAQAATVAATRPVPASAAPRRKPRRVREASSTVGSVASGPCGDGGGVPEGVVDSMIRDGTASPTGTT